MKLPNRPRAIVGVAVAIVVVVGGAAFAQFRPTPSHDSAGVGADSLARSADESLAVAGSVPEVVPEAAAPEAAVPVAEAPAPPAPAPTEVVIAPPPESFSEPAGPAAPAPEALRSAGFEGVTPAGGTWAVIIGINNYPGPRYDLQSAVNDANDLNDALGRFGVASDHRLVLRDGEATADRIRKSAQWLTAHAGPDATAIFFYAGHVRKLGGSTEAVIAADGAAVTDAELGRSLDGLRAGKAWIVMASCYGGGFTELLKPGRILTAAAPADSLAYENLDFGRSYLVEYMVRRSMIAAGTSTVEQAFAQATNALGKDFPHRVPVQTDNLPGDLQLRAGTPPPPQPPPPPPPAAPPPPPAAPPPTTTPPLDGCAGLTLGIIRCPTPA